MSVQAQLKTLISRLDRGQIKTENVVGLLIMVAFLLLFACMFQSLKLHRAIRSVNETTIAKNEIESLVKKENLGKADYAKAAKTLRELYPAILFTPGDSSLIISAEKEDAYVDWMLALTALQSVAPQVYWDVNTLCVGKCESNRSAAASVKGFRQTVTLTQVQEKEPVAAEEKSAEPPK